MINGSDLLSGTGHDVYYHKCLASIYNKQQTGQCLLSANALVETHYELFNYCRTSDIRDCFSTMQFSFVVKALKRNEQLAVTSIRLRLRIQFSI